MTNAYYRTISSHTTLFLVFLVIFLLYKFFQKPSLFMLPIMLFCFIVIVTESHRSVWLAAITALLMSSLLVLRNKNSRLKIKNFWLVACMLISFLLILSYGQNIKYLDFLTTRLDDVYKFSYIYGTGMFRYRQYEHYLPYIMNNFFLGMRFSGFELPALYRAWSGDWSGHLFHSGYLNIFFYHGLFGFYLLYSPALYYIFKVLSLKTYGSDVITVTSFVAACIVYSLAYQPDIIFFALLGVGFALLETEQKNIEHGTGAM